MSLVQNPALVVKEITQSPERDNHQNWSYWVACEGLDKNVAVSHKGDKPVMRPGDTFEKHGFIGYEVRRSQAGNEYYKAVRPQKQNNSNGGNRGDLSPEAQARIDAVGRAKARCHAQAVAASMLAASGDLGEVNFHDPNQAGAFLNGTMRPLIDWLVKDAEQARNTTPPASGTQQPQGVSNGNGA